MKIKYAIRFIGIFLFILICIKVNVKDSWKTLIQTNLIYLFYSVVLGFIVIGMRVFRWKMLLVFYKIVVPFFQCYILTLIGNAYGSLTPGRIGELIRPYYLHKKGYSFILSLKSAIIDRLFDLSSIFIFGLLSLIYFFLDAFISIKINILPLLLLLITPLLFIVFWRRYEVPIKRKAKYWIPEKFKVLLLKGEKEQRKLSEMSLRQKGNLSLISIIAFLATCLKFFCLAIALNINLSFFFLVLIMSMLMLSRLIPISFLNLGSREAVLIFMFGLKGLAQEEALAFSLLILVDMVFFIAVGQIIAWIYFPKLREAIKAYDNTSGSTYS